ncbi:MAG TPA: glucan biosynthesis protein G [Burkholderiales bacterium]
MHHASKHHTFESLRIVRAAAAAWMLFGGAAAAAGAPPDADPVFAQVAEQARALAAQPYAPPRYGLPPALAAIDYDAYRDIRFRPAKALWRGESPFEVQLFHLGYLYRDPVKIHTVVDGVVRPLRFDRDMFDYGNTGLGAAMPPDLHFAGFRVHYPLNRPDYKDELVAFLGASYFRLLGRNQVYGLSARGLAVDTALPKGEEFPAFREFWLVRPARNATAMTIYALLDSRSVTGAYRFRITPGDETVMDVEATLYARANVERLGIAPLTSMFFFGENHARDVDDYRPEVHDSDGLLMHTHAGEWIWRPLTNPQALRVTALLDENPRGFGLLQRDRRFEHYLDLESHFERRPSFWIEPCGVWGKGAVHLVEIPSAEEIHDNIVAFWVPEQPLAAGESRTVAYRLRAMLASPPGAALARVERTRIGWGAVPGTAKKPPRSLRRFLVDFAGGELPLLAETQPVAARLTATGGEVSDLTVQRIPASGGWRVSFRLAPTSAEAVDMRLFLELDGRRLTETWNYVWSPREIH